MWNQGPYVGTSGFAYKTFVGPLYPRGFPQTRWLDHYVTAFNTVELNNTFYHLPRPATIETWHEKAPPRNDVLLQRFLNVLSMEFTHVLEFRHASWFVPEVLDRLEAAGVAAASVSSPKLQSGVLATGPIVYVRFHGAAQMFVSSYSDAELEQWAKDARDKSQDRPVFAYFNNDAQGHAVPNARTLAALLGSPPQKGEA